MIVPAEAPPETSPSRETMKYAITQNSAMKRYPPIRWAAIKRPLYFVLLSLADDCRMSHTLIAPLGDHPKPAIEDHFKTGQR